MQQFLHISGALYDESSVKILAFLARYGELCVCDLQASLGMIQSRLSRHLKILKEAGFLSVRREGVLWNLRGAALLLQGRTKNDL